VGFSLTMDNLLLLKKFGLPAPSLGTTRFLSCILID
jgi:hypothetical protein